LRNLHPDGNAEWQAFLVKGTQQSGAPKTAITALEDRLIREYPSSDQASAIVQQRWAETNKEPMDESDTAAWSRYQKEHEKAVMGWIRNYPDDTYLQRYGWFDTILEDDTISEKEGIAALDAHLQSIKDFDPANFWGYFEAAEFLVEHRWQPTRAIQLSRQAAA